MPAVGGGAGVGVAALKIAEHFKASPAAVAAITAAVGTVGTILAPKGSALASMSSAVAGLGTGLAVIDLLQKPHAQAQQPQQQRQADGGYVTREDLNEALRREMLRHHEQMMGAMRDELRNAAAAYAPQSPERPAFESWHDAPELPEERNAEPPIESWHYASEPQAA